jgi:P27 family predicted phage terminase small subunit
MPREVRENPTARRFWREHADHLEATGRLTPEYRQSYARLCLTHARIQSFEATIAKDGAIITGPRGGQQRHPLLTALRQSETTYNELIRRFGLDPQSAARLPKVRTHTPSLREQMWRDLADDKFFGDGGSTLNKYTKKGPDGKPTH